MSPFLLEITLNIILCYFVSFASESDAPYFVASHTYMSSSSSCYKVLLTVVFVADIVVSHSVDAVSIVNATGIFTVPCGASTTYGPEIGVGAQFLLQNCVHQTLGTQFSLVLNESSSASDGFSIVVRDSRRISVLIRSSVDIVKLSIIITNVTNDIDERQATDSHVCSPTACGSVLTCYQMRSLINMSIALTNITHARNQSMLYFQRIDGNITGLSATIVNSSLLSNGSVIGIDSVTGGGLYSSNITIDSVHQITSVSFSGYVMVLLTGIPMIGSGVYVSVSRCSLGGFVNASSGASIIAIQASLVLGGSFIVSNFTSQVKQGLSVGAVAFFDAATTNGTTVSVSNFTADGTEVGTSVVILQNSTIRGALLSVSWISVSVAITLIASGTPVTLVLVLASSVADSNITISHVTFTSYMTPSYVLSSQVALPYYSQRSLFHSTVVLMSGCIISGALASLLSLNTTDAVGIMIYIVSSFTQPFTSAQASYLPFVLSLVTAVDLFVSISASSLQGMYPVAFQATNVVNATFLVSDCSLISTDQLSMTTQLAALYLYNASLRRTSIVISNSSMISTSTNVWSAISFLSVRLLSGTNISISLRELVSSSSLSNGGTVVVADSIFSESLVTIVLTVPSATFSSFAFSSLAVDINSSTFLNDTTINLNLPYYVPVGSTTTLTVVRLERVSFASTSSLITVIVLAGLGSPNTATVISVVNSFVTDGGALVIKQGISAASTPPMTIVVSGSNFSDSEFQLGGISNNAQLQISRCHFSTANDTALRSQTKQRPLLVVSANSTNASLALFITQTSVTVPWVLPTPTSRWAFLLMNMTSGGSFTTTCSLSLYTDQLFVYGITSLLTLPTSTRLSTVVMVVKLIQLNCSWWGRHQYTASLAPLHQALKGSVLRDGAAGPFSSLFGPTTVLRALPNSSIVSSDPSLCPLGVDGNRRETSFSYTSSDSQSSGFSWTHSPTTSAALHTTTTDLITESHAYTSTNENISVSSSTFTSTTHLSNTMSSSPPHTRTNIVSLSVTPRLPHSATYVLSLTPSNVQPAPNNVVVLNAPPAIQAAAYASMAGAVVGGGTMGEAATIATLAMMTCAGKRTWAANTGAQRLVVSVFYDLGPGASIVGNVGITLVVYALQRGYVIAMRRSQNSATQIVAVDATALVRYPSLSWALLMFLFPGILFSAVSLFSTPSDDLIGASVAGRAVFGSITLVGAVSVVAGIVYHAIKRVFPTVHPASTADVLCEPHLPRWFLRIAGSWLLPRVMWEPNELKLQYGEFFSSVASIDAMRVTPLLQVHGAVFSLIAVIPFPQSACIAQFVLAIVWMCVPVGLLLKWELRLLRRPPSNPLVLLSNLVVIGVLIATLIFVEGPVSAQSAAASARDALGDVLTAVTVLNTCITAVGTAAEFIATRSTTTTPNTISSRVVDDGKVSDWLHSNHQHAAERLGAAHHQHLQHRGDNNLVDSALPYDHLGDEVSAHLANGATAAAIGVSSTSFDRHYNAIVAGGHVTSQSRPFGSFDRLSPTAGGVATLSFVGRSVPLYTVDQLDRCIEHIINDPIYVAARQMDNEQVLSEQRDRVIRFTLKLLVTRGARGGRRRSPSPEKATHHKSN